jgi:hypothetical protein
MNRFSLKYLSQPILNKEYTNTNNNNNNNNPIFNKNKTFYICSFGGCGSTVLYNYLSNFGNVEHVHDRFPPQKLCYVGSNHSNENTYYEWFNKTEVPENELQNITVIYIYRNPLDVIYSRFVLTNGQAYTRHLNHIMCKNNGDIQLCDVLFSNQDLYGMEEFFDNYTTSQERNYKIHCVKYELFWNNINLFNQIIGIPDIKSLYPIKKERKKQIHFKQQLNKIYSSLIQKMKSKKFVEIV